MCLQLKEVKITECDMHEMRDISAAYMNHPHVNQIWCIIKNSIANILMSPGNSFNFFEIYASFTTFEKCLLNFLSTSRVPAIKGKINLIKYEIAMKAYTTIAREISKNYNYFLPSTMTGQGKKQHWQSVESRAMFSISGASRTAH